MKFAMFRTLSLVLCFVAASQQLEISKFSVPEAVVKGSNTELLCEHDVADNLTIVKWFWSPDGPDSRKQIYQRAFDGEQEIAIPRVEPPLNITLLEEDKHNLALWNLQPEHSGTFECKVEEQKGNFTERGNASDLVVYTIGVGPQLSYIYIEDDTEEVVVVCEATGVAPEPDITISYDSTTFNTTVVVGPIDGLYNVSTNATLTQQDIEGKEFSCMLSFGDTDFITATTTDTYHSDAWAATSTAAPDDTDSTEVSAAITHEQSTPGSARRVGVAWALAALVSLLHLRL